ncbi:MAG: hypothetical protein HS117_10975 [Verrucomicrobiaceae bacterium]|nr:hypothetical protein [Verrucomicrobiaceae bacterium]
MIAVLGHFALQKFIFVGSWDSQADFCREKTDFQAADLHFLGENSP